MTSKVGLIGWPVEHSVSPAMHNAAFRALGMDWRYDPLPVLPSEVKRRIDALIEAGYCGFNVTVPHKGEVLKLPDIKEAEGAIAEIGAANTLAVLPEGGLRASNTDWQGFLADLAAHGINPQGLDCIILGTGGASRAVDYALRSADANSILRVSRNPIQYDAVITYEDLGPIMEFASIQANGKTLIVNCTPAGMWPNVDATPWPANVPFPKDAILYDLVYNPASTRTMQQAVAAGAQAFGGLGMLVRQGALSFEQWTGVTPPLDVMENAARETLAAQ
jgi:shikimate dehydrogenase